MRILIKKIKLLDPFSQKKIKKAWIIIEEGKIREISEHKIPNYQADKVIDGKNCVAFPGLIDIHTHLREPGLEHKEDIASGSLAALHGGFTTISAFPNTNPVIDSVAALRELKKRIEEKALVTILPIASITEGLKGKKLSPMEELAKEGALAFTDDGKGVQDEGILYQAMLEAKRLSLPLLLHSESEFLAKDGVINQGKISSRLNLKGIPNEAEEIMIARDIVLAKLTRARVHFCHVSTPFGARMIQLAKKEKINITAEITPHHLCFFDAMIQSIHETHKKMNPPLRSQSDQEKMVRFLKKNVIDAIATDHAPHSKEEKAMGFHQAPFGIVGLETALPLLYTYLVKPKKVSFYRIIEAMTKKPADILYLPYHRIEEKKEPNIIIFNKKEKSILSRSFFYSKSDSFPLKDETLAGKVEWVFYGGKLFDFRKKQYEVLYL